MMRAASLFNGSGGLGSSLSRSEAGDMARGGGGGGGSPWWAEGVYDFDATVTLQILPPCRNEGIGVSAKGCWRQGVSLYSRSLII